jgi:cobalt-zinc-cadmium efflux system outer membrane protein
MHEAGNITDRQLALEQAQHEQAKLELAAGEAIAADAREQLNALMGLWGAQTAWVAETHLPDLPDEETGLREIERLALASSLDLAAARFEIEGLGERLGLERTFGLVPELEAGVTAEREHDGEWGVGPAVSLPIPLFNQGEPAVAAARARLEAARQEYFARAVEIRAAARAARLRVLNARQRAIYYRDVMLPLRQQIVEETQLEYNAMLIGAFELLLAKQEQIEAGAQYIESLRDYWIASARLDQILAGRAPSMRGGMVHISPGSTSAGRGVESEEDRHD